MALPQCAPTSSERGEGAISVTEGLMIAEGSDLRLARGRAPDPKNHGRWQWSGYSGSTTRRWLRFLALRLGFQQAGEGSGSGSVCEAAEPGGAGERSASLGGSSSRSQRTLATDRMRARQRRPFSSSMLFEEFQSDQPLPERQVGSEQELAIVQRLVSELPAKCRRAFLLQRINGLSTAAIATQMG